MSDEAPSLLPHVADPIGGDAYSPIRFYSTELADQICELYMNGATFTQIAAEPRMPAIRTLYKWMKENPEMKEKVAQAREIRAIMLEDRALTEAFATMGKDDTPAQRLKFDAAVWAASVNDPTRYGKRTVLSGDSEKPVTIIVKTGVPHPEDFVEKVAEKLVENEADGGEPESL